MIGVALISASVVLAFCSGFAFGISRRSARIDQAFADGLRKHHDEIAEIRHRLSKVDAIRDAQG